MTAANPPATYLPPQSIPQVQLLLLQVLAELRVQNNGTIVDLAQAVRRCAQSLEKEGKRRRELSSRCDDDHSKLHNELLNAQEYHLLAGAHIEELEDRLKKFSKQAEEEINTLQKHLHKEKSARLFCERELALRKECSVLEQANAELNQLKNGSHYHNPKIDEILATLQQISENQKSANEIIELESQLKLAKESIEKSSDMYAKQTMELENERRKTLALETQKAEIEASLQSLLKEQQEQKEREAELLKMERRKTEELVNKENEVINEKKKNVELQKILDETVKSHSQSEKHKAELLEAERRNCSTQLQQQKTESESKVQQEVKKMEEVKINLNNCKHLLKIAKEQTDEGRGYVNKVIDFAKTYKKYVGSGNLNYAVAVFGDPEIKNIFRSSESITGKQMSNEEACGNGFSCGNGRCIPKCFICDGTDDCGNRNDESNCSTSMFPNGARVVRGKDWDWQSQDGDPPGVGTVVEEGENGGWTSVKWDNGHKNSYRIGVDRKVDLRAAAGYFCEAT